MNAVFSNKMMKATPVASFVKGTAAARGGAKFGRKALNRWHRRFSGNLEVA
jgi:hypothetical protein